MSATLPETTARARLDRGLRLLTLYAGITVVGDLAGSGGGFLLGWFGQPWPDWLSAASRALSLVEWMLLAGGVLEFIRGNLIRRSHLALIALGGTAGIFVFWDAALLLVRLAESVSSVQIVPDHASINVINIILGLCSLVLVLACASIAYMISNRFRDALIGRVHVVVLIAIGVLVWSIGFSTAVLGWWLSDPAATAASAAWLTTYVTLSLASATGVIVFHATLWHALRRAQRRIPDKCCLACGYDLTGNESGVCPECGMATAKGEA